MDDTVARHDEMPALAHAACESKRDLRSRPLARFKRAAPPFRHWSHVNSLRAQKQEAVREVRRATLNAALHAMPHRFKLMIVKQLA